MQLCPDNQSLSVPWVRRGLNPCFCDVVTYSVLFGIALLFGSFQFLAYRKYSTVNSHRRHLKYPKLYILHLACHVFLTGTATAEFFTSVYSIQNGTYYIYQILALCFKGRYMIVPHFNISAE